MRNPERINPILELLAAEWREHPDLRLGQLLWMLNGGDDPFYMEDDALARTLAQEHDLDDPFAEMEYYR